MIRRVDPDEWERFRELRLTALAEAPYAFGSTLARELGFDEETWRARLARGRQLVAERDGDWLGTVAGVAAEDGSGAELVSMWVAPQARGGGLGAELVLAVIDWARAAGHDRLSLWVAEGNQRAERLYLRLGFARTGRVVPIRPEEPDRLEAEMSLRLTHPPVPSASAWPGRS